MGKLKSFVFYGVFVNHIFYFSFLCLRLQVPIFRGNFRIDFYAEFVNLFCFTIPGLCNG